MNLDFIAGMVKPYIPTIIEKYLPQVSASIAEQLRQEDDKLAADESETVYMLSREGDKVMLRTVRLNAQAKVVRSTPPVQIEVFLEELITKALNTTH